MAHPFTNVSSRPEEEKDVGRKSDDDFDVLKQVDITQSDDSLISLALADLARQQPGPELVSFVFAIIRHREPSVEQNDTSTWGKIEHLPVPLLRSVAQALSEALRSEHDRIAKPYMSLTTLCIWDDWVRMATLFLVYMSQQTWFIPQFHKAISSCLSIAHPTFIDTFLDSISASEDLLKDQNARLVKDTILHIDSSAGDYNDPRPLVLRNLSDKAWERIMVLFESVIFEQAPLLPRNDDISLALRAVFSESQQSIPANISERIRNTFHVDQLVERTMHPITSEHVQRNGRAITSYVSRVLRIFHSSSTLESDFSHLTEHSSTIVSHLLVLCLKDEVETRSGLYLGPSEWDNVFLNIVCMMISSVRYGRSVGEADAILSFFKATPDTMVDNILLRLSKDPTRHPISTLIPALLRPFLRTDGNLTEEPWNSTLEIPADSSTRSTLANVTARCLTIGLGKTDQGTSSDISLWVKWGTHLLLSCFEGDTMLLNPTAFFQLVSPNPHHSICSIPPAEDERQISRLWRMLCTVDPSQRLLFIMSLWPTNFILGEKRIPFKLLQMHADSLNKSVVEVFLQHAPKHAPTFPRVAMDFIYSFLEHCRRSGDVLERRLDELQPFIQTGEADFAVAQIAASTRSSKNPTWPVWMKEYLARRFGPRQSASEINKLTECICWNATEGVAFIASYDVGELDNLPDNLLTFRKYVSVELWAMFRTFEKHPEPLDPVPAEKCLMRLLVHAEVSRLMWTFCTHIGLGKGIPPPRYACVCFITRILRYYLDPKGVSVTHKDIRSPLDFSQLEKEVWDDASAAAAEILNRTDHYNNDDHEDEYFGGRISSSMARMDAIIILLATSPYPFTTDLSYEVLEQDPFFCWEDNPAIQPDVQRDLEERRQRRIEEEIGRAHV